MHWRETLQPKLFPSNAFYTSKNRTSSAWFHFQRDFHFVYCDTWRFDATNQIISLQQPFFKHKRQYQLKWVRISQVSTIIVSLTHTYNQSTCFAFHIFLMNISEQRISDCRNESQGMRNMHEFVHPQIWVCMWSERQEMDKWWRLKMLAMVIKFDEKQKGKKFCCRKTPKSHGKIEASRGEGGAGGAMTMQNGNPLKT